MYTNPKPSFLPHHREDPALRDSIASLDRLREQMLSHSKASLEYYKLNQLLRELWRDLYTVRDIIFPIIGPSSRLPQPRSPVDWELGQ